MFGQLAEVKQYLKRVKDAGGVIRDDVQLELNNFSKKVYQLGLRSTNNNNHKIEHCSVYPTESKTGSNYYLWSKTAAISHPTDSYSYTKEKGLKIIGSAEVNTGLLGESLISSDVSIGYYSSLINKNDGEVGGVSGVYPADVRCFSHPQYLTNNLMYFDIGETTSNRTFGRNPDNRGLTVCSKDGTDSVIYNKNSLVASRTDLDFTTPLPTTNMRFKASVAGTREMYISGFWWGKSIPTSAIAELTQAWDNLQLKIHPQRHHSVADIPSPKMWYDVSDVSSLIREPGTNNVVTWNDRSGYSKHLSDGRTGFTVKYDPINQGINFNNGGGYARLQVSDGFYTGTFAIVLTSDDPLSDAIDDKSRKAFVHDYEITTSAFNGLGFGDKSSWMDDEVAWFIGNQQGSGRFYISSTALTIPADKKFLLIFSRLGDRQGLIKYNNTTPTVGYAVGGGSSATLEYVSNRSLRFGQEVGDTSAGVGHWQGLMHEFRCYSEQFTTTQMDALAQELTAKWGIS